MGKSDMLSHMLFTGTAKLFVVPTFVQLQLEATTKLQCNSNSFGYSASDTADMSKHLRQ